MANEYDLATLKVSEVEAWDGAAPTRATLVLAVIDGKPYTITVAQIQDAV